MILQDELKTRLLLGLSLRVRGAAAYVCSSVRVHSMMVN
jgi:hypothetical protein